MPLRYLKTKNQIQKKKNARNEKKLLEIREVGKKNLWKALSNQLEQFWSYSTFQQEWGWWGALEG